MPRSGLRIGLRGWFLVQPALQDEPLRSRGFLGQGLAVTRPNTDPNISGQIAFRYPIWVFVCCVCVCAAVFHQAGFGGLDRRSDVPCVCVAVAMPRQQQQQQQQQQPMMFWHPQMPMQPQPSTVGANESSSDAEQQDIENNDAY